MTFEPIAVNAARICDGLRKIGYVPTSAIADIIDNAVQANAHNIYVLVVPAVVSEARKNNVNEYLIIDDGVGMDAPGIRNALKLGASDEGYGNESLSKFGLGLKSAAFSQGEVLEVISSDGTDPFRKLRVSLPVIRLRGEYGAEVVALSDEDKRLIETYLPGKHGTIIRIAEVRMQNHPSIKSTFDDLEVKLGVIYYYMMRDEGLRIYLVDIHNNNRECLPFDVLFTNEADSNGDLDEHTWDGRVTQWIERTRTITLDPELNVTAKIEVTQLPYPPIFSLEDPDRQSEIRKKYRISKPNSGYYIYRNRRLLAWAESFEGMIPREQDYFAFRGRILIDDSADEILNIDVKKSQFHPSEIAYQALEDASQEYRRKSRKAWQQANSERLRKLNAEPLGLANDIAQQIDMPEELPGAASSEEDYQELDIRQKAIEIEQEKKAKSLTIQNRSDMSLDNKESTTSNTAPTPEEIVEAVIGGEAEEGDKIFLVNNTEDNVLWEPLYFGGRDCVRINRLHRFATLIYEDHKQNANLGLLFNLLLLNMAGAEFYVQRRFKQFPRETIEEIIKEYRRVATEFLATLVRQGKDLIPTE